jgi:hypothetical protein
MGDYSGTTERGLEIVLHRLTLESGADETLYRLPRVIFGTFALDPARHAPAGLESCWRRCSVPPLVIEQPAFRFLLM